MYRWRKNANFYIILTPVLIVITTYNSDGNDNEEPMADLSSFPPSVIELDVIF